jgi:hypothetical protein
LEHDHARTPELPRPGSDPQPVTEQYLAQVVYLDADNMDRPTALREYVIRKSEASQGLEAGLFEIVEMDRVIDVAEGVQLVGADFDNGFRDAQFLPSSGRKRRGTRPRAVIASTTPVTAPSASRMGVEITSTRTTVPSLSSRGAPTGEWLRRTWSPLPDVALVVVLPEGRSSAHTVARIKANAAITTAGVIPSRIGCA